MLKVCYLKNPREAMWMLMLYTYYLRSEVDNESLLLKKFVWDDLDVAGLFWGKCALLKSSVWAFHVSVVKHLLFWHFAMKYHGIGCCCFMLLWRIKIRNLWVILVAIDWFFKSWFIFRATWVCLPSTWCRSYIRVLSATVWLLKLGIVIRIILVCFPCTGCRSYIRVLEVLG